MIDVREVNQDTLEPILTLLQSPDIDVQRAASAALGNLAVNSTILCLQQLLNAY
jgi:vacuolar protein 8